MPHIAAIIFLGGALWACKSEVSVESRRRQESRLASVAAASCEPAAKTIAALGLADDPAKIDPSSLVAKDPRYFFVDYLSGQPEIEVYVPPTEGPGDYNPDYYLLSILDRGGNTCSETHGNIGGFVRLEIPADCPWPLTLDAAACINDFRRKKGSPKCGARLGTTKVTQGSAPINKSAFKQVVAAQKVLHSNRREMVKIGKAMGDLSARFLRQIKGFDKKRLDLLLGRNDTTAHSMATMLSMARYWRSNWLSLSQILDDKVASERLAEQFKEILLAFQQQVKGKKSGFGLSDAGDLCDASTQVADASRSSSGAVDVNKILDAKEKQYAGSESGDGDSVLSIVKPNEVQKGDPANVAGQAQQAEEVAQGADVLTWIGVSSLVIGTLFAAKAVYNFATFNKKKRKELANRSHDVFGDDTIKAIEAVEIEDGNLKLEDIRYISTPDIHGRIATYEDKILVKGKNGKFELLSADDLKDRIGGKGKITLEKGKLKFEGGAEAEFKKRFSTEFNDMVEAGVTKATEKEEIKVTEEDKIVGMKEESFGGIKEGFGDRIRGSVAPMLGAILFTTIGVLSVQHGQDLAEDPIVSAFRKYWAEVGKGIKRMMKIRSESAKADAFVVRKEVEVATTPPSSP